MKNILTTNINVSFTENRKYQYPLSFKNRAGITILPRTEVKIANIQFKSLMGHTGNYFTTSPDSNDPWICDEHSYIQLSGYGPVVGEYKNTEDRPWFFSIDLSDSSYEESGNLSPELDIYSYNILRFEINLEAVMDDSRGNTKIRKGYFFTYHNDREYSYLSILNGGTIDMYQPTGYVYYNTPLYYKGNKISGLNQGENPVYYFISTYDSSTKTLELNIRNLVD